jgi:hypothetical protein
MRLCFNQFLCQFGFSLGCSRRSTGILNILRLMLLACLLFIDSFPNDFASLQSSREKKLCTSLGTKFCFGFGLNTGFLMGGVYFSFSLFFRLVFKRSKNWIARS